MKVHEKEKTKGLWKNKRELKIKKRQLLRPAEQRGATGRRDPRRMELMNCRRNFK